MKPVEEVEREANELAADLEHRYRERLIIFALRRVRDHALAEDVAQETLRRVLEALREGRVMNRDALPGFIFQTAQNVCLHHHRFVRRSTNAFTLWGRSQETADLATAVDRLISKEERAAVRRALEELAPTDRSLLRMLYVDGRDALEVASELEIPAGTLRVRKFRALQRLEEILTAGETFSGKREQGNDEP